jgi:hypothetical protein
MRNDNTTPYRSKSIEAGTFGEAVQDLIDAGYTPGEVFATLAVEDNYDLLTATATLRRLHQPSETVAA